MIWYLMQHGKALSEEVDPHRSLSAEGIEEVGAVARGLKFLEIRPDLIFSSTKKRAVQTAELVAQVIAYSTDDIIKDDVFRPSAQPDEMFLYLERHGEEKENVLIVGHLPSLGHLTDALVDGTDTVEFVNAGIVCVKSEGVQKGTGKVLWYIRPEHFIKLLGSLK